MKPYQKPFSLMKKTILKVLDLSSSKKCAVKAYIQFCLDEEDSFEDEINDFIEDKRLSQVFAYMINCWVNHLLWVTHYL